jgi:hypothetical protein
MARKKPDQEAPAVQAAPVFKKADLVENAPAVFGVSPEMMAGALYSVEEATKAEAQALLDKFKTKGVK